MLHIRDDALRVDPGPGIGEAGGGAAPAVQPAASTSATSAVTRGAATPGAVWINGPPEAGPKDCSSGQGIFVDRYELAADLIRSKASPVAPTSPSARSRSPSRLGD